MRKATPATVPPAFSTSWHMARAVPPVASRSSATSTSAVGGDGVGVGLEGVGAVLELVGGGDGLARQLVGLAGEDQALSGAVGEGGAEDEAAGFGGEDAVVVEAVGGEGEGVDGGVQGLAVLDEGGYVLEGDAGGGEVGYGADEALEVADRSRRSGPPLFPSGGEGRR